jgi:LPXTG-motif cell wall-anchored protein
MERIGICLACHQDIPDGTPSIAMLTKIAKMLDKVPKTDQEHRDLIQDFTRLAARVQVIGPIVGIIILAFLGWFFFVRRKK